MTNNLFYATDKIDLLLTPSKGKAKPSPLEGISILNVHQKSLDKLILPRGWWEDYRTWTFFSVSDLGLVNFPGYLLFCTTCYVWSPVKGIWPSVLPFYKVSLRKWLFQRVADSWEPRNLALRTSCLTSRTIWLLGDYTSSCEWLGQERKLSPNGKRRNPNPSYLDRQPRMNPWRVLSLYHITLYII